MDVALQVVQEQHIPILPSLGKILKRLDPDQHHLNRQQVEPVACSELVQGWMGGWLSCSLGEAVDATLDGTHPFAQLHQTYHHISTLASQSLMDGTWLAYLVCDLFAQVQILVCPPCRPRNGLNPTQVHLGRTPPAHYSFTKECPIPQVSPNPHHTTK